MTHYTLYPVDVWVDPNLHERLREAVQGQWVTCQEAATHADLSPTARAVLVSIQERETHLNAEYLAKPIDKT